MQALHSSQSITCIGSGTTLLFYCFYLTSGVVLESCLQLLRGLSITSMGGRAHAEDIKQQNSLLCAVYSRSAYRVFRPDEDTDQARPDQARSKVTLSLGLTGSYMIPTIQQIPSPALKLQFKRILREAGQLADGQRVTYIMPGVMLVPKCKRNV